MTLGTAAMRAPAVREVGGLPSDLEVTVAARIPMTTAVQHRMVAIARRHDGVVLGMVDPLDTGAIGLAEETLGVPIHPVTVAAAAMKRCHAAVYRAQATRESVSGLEDRYPDASARRILSSGQKMVAALLVVATIAGMAMARHLFLLGAMHVLILTYGVYVSFRAYVIYRGLRESPEQRVTAEQLSDLTDLPVYTVISPMYRETAVLPQLLDAIAALDYPSELLDVKLVVEADDVDMLSALGLMELPGNIDVVVVPVTQPRTKPKACNYALQFARGDYVVIFDAEDLPERDQLKKAVALFRRADPGLGCVQAKLNFHNSRQNWLTGWFTLEYTAWFDLFLPGLVSLGLPIPLGGTSNHFPIGVLRELGAWDAFNVTEDADLGMRLDRAGYHTAVVDSTTWEEANSDFVNWVKQRSRWAKGYAISWLVHMRHPVTLRREMGWRKFLALQLILGGTFGSSIVNVLVWAMTGLWVTTGASSLASLFPSDIYYIAMLEALVGNFIFLYVNVHCVAHRRMFHLSRIALLSPLYWLMMGLAVVKGLIQLVHNPAFWEKTTHGLAGVHRPADVLGPCDPAPVDGALRTAPALP